MTKNAELTNLPRRQGLGETLAEKTGTKPDFERKAPFSWCEKHFRFLSLSTHGLKPAGKMEFSEINFLSQQLH